MNLIIEKSPQKQTHYSYYSQHEQDRFINENIFFNKKGGFFVEIGAYDGISISNTYFFEKTLNWTGICIEPMEDKFLELISNRKCICINGCISDKESVEKFLKIQGGGEWTRYCSGLIKHYHPEHLSLINKELNLYGGSKQIIEVPCFRLDSILDQYNVHHIDYLSMDTEGGELEILKSLNLDKYHIEVISIENLYLGETLKHSLDCLGYKYLCRLGHDEIYQKKA